MAVETAGGVPEGIDEVEAALGFLFREAHLPRRHARHRLLDSRRKIRLALVHPHRNDHHAGRGRSGARHHGEQVPRPKTSWFHVKSEI